MSISDEERKNAKDLDEWIEQLYKCKQLGENQVKLLCAKAQALFAVEANVCPVTCPVTICGDVHGQWHDLIELFNVAGKAPDTNFVFMGDYVDRGRDSVQVLTLIIALKVRFPDRVTVLRGNHESRQVSQVYGFYDECMSKYGGPAVWKYFSDLFDYMPFGALVENEMICMHGGLSPSLPTIDSMQSLQRVGEVDTDGPIGDVLWSDPDDAHDTWATSSRGAGHLFGPSASQQFLYANRLRMITRAHQMVFQGYEHSHGGNVCTIFSAPNYCYRAGNAAAIAQLDDIRRQTFITFDASPHNIRSTPLPERKMPQYFL